MLTGYRVLDLTDEKGFLCGKILGDLGADVIKVERPGGDTARNIAPFYHDTPDPEKSLHWFAFNASKRGVTLNIEDPEGQDLFKKLSDTADFIIESFPPGYMEKQGLGYSALSTRNPKLIMTSITPFGQTGPYKDRKASEIVIMAMGGMTDINGDSDRPPLRLYLDQAYYLASSYAAAGTLLALHCRYAAGKGQQVDVSIYECVVRANYREPIRWEYTQMLTSRMGNLFARGGRAYRQLWPCKDGYVTWLLMPDNVKPVRAFVEWMKEEGAAGRWGEMNWDEVSLLKWSPEEQDALTKAIADFIATHTVKELEKASIQRGLLLSPVNSVDLVAEDEQLLARGDWKKIEHPELGATFNYSRFTYLTSEGNNEVRFRAPLVGEHNDEIYGKELGLSKETLTALKQKGVL
ncbi:MAG: CoA transferase [Deltaproteobacteria bacterium]|nr:CoA transferase [Deltaproteobacteria bacterium]